MTGLNTISLLLIGLTYLLSLFAVAWMAEARLIPQRILQAKTTYVLSLAAYASSFGIYGVVYAADVGGYSFLAYYGGVSLAFVLAPILLAPLMRICRVYRLNSLADLLAFRFRKQWLGTLTTLGLSICVLPLMAMQIKAISHSAELIAAPGTASDYAVNFPTAFCLSIAVFAALFGARNLSTADSHQGLVAAIAVESVIKLVAFTAAGFCAVYFVFGGFSEMHDWLAANPEKMRALHEPVSDDSLRMLLLMFLSAAVAMPHMFHMLYAENPSQKALRSASWGLPLYLLLMALPVLPILWAGQALNATMSSEYYALATGLMQARPGITTVVFLGGLAAASGLMIITTLALASMALNHIVLPLHRPNPDRNIYQWLLWLRRGIITLGIFASYQFSRLISDELPTAALGIIALVGLMQFLPAVFCVLYWPKANSRGVGAGLIIGLLVWIFGLLIPAISGLDPSFIQAIYSSEVPITRQWLPVAVVSFVSNIVLLTVVSALSKTTEEERLAAEACTIDDLNRPTRHALSFETPAEMQRCLAEGLGRETAEREVKRALQDLNMSPQEQRPYALRRLRDQLEINLSALMGPSVGRNLIEQWLPYTDGMMPSQEDITFVEDKLEEHRLHLTGLAADLDNLRRRHRQTLSTLPIGLVALGRDREILMWNESMERLTGIDSAEVTGSRIDDLPEPWNTTLVSFFDSGELSLRKMHLASERGDYWINLHKAADHAERNEQDILIEDITDTQMLENTLAHQERLASIGRLAAGVAHEIGNPVTGIACLAQNLRYEVDNSEASADIEQILQQTDRITSIVQSLVNFAHQGQHHGKTANREPVALKPCIDQAIQLLLLDPDATTVSYQNHCPDKLAVQGDAQRLSQVLINLLSNARDASQEGQSVNIDATMEDGMVHISVSDTGSGIAEEHLAQIFEPFYTTKDAGKGTGLGLALAYSFIEEMQGEIRLESPNPAIAKGGTVAHIQLPAAPAGM